MFPFGLTDLVSLVHLNSHPHYRDNSNSPTASSTASRICFPGIGIRFVNEPSGTLRQNRVESSGCKYCFTPIGPWTLPARAGLLQEDKGRHALHANRGGAGPTHGTACEGFLVGNKVGELNCTRKGIRPIRPNPFILNDLSNL